MKSVRRVESFEKKMARLQAVKRKPVVCKVFDDVDLRCGHKGLGLIARKHNLSPENLGPGLFLLFINRGGTAVKLLANGNVMVYLKSATGEKIDMKVIEMLPRFFNGTDFDFGRSAAAGLKKVA